MDNQNQNTFGLEEIVTVLPVHIYWKNRNCILLGCNLQQAKDVGLQSCQDIVGKTAYDLICPNLPETVRRGQAELTDRIDREVMESNRARTFEETAILPNGRTVYYLSTKVPLHDKDGNVVGLVGVSMDITKQKRAQAALKIAKEKAESANKAKTEFLENMRHDIRTPLSGIVGFADLLKEEVKSETAQSYADNLIASGRALLDLLSSILESIKVATGEIPLLKKKFDLKSLLLNLVNLYKTKAGEKKLKLELDYDSRIARYLVGDPIRIQRIASELLSNALKFTQKGFVKVSAVLAKSENREAVIKLIVQDTGMGIPKEKQQEIFLQFKRLIPSYEGIYKGFGLGLTIVKKFMEDLQGEIYVDSEPNKGTTFVCLIPIREALLDEEVGIGDEPETLVTIETPLVSEQTKQLVFEAGNAPQSRILLVEDTEFTADIQKKLLESLDARVDVASTGATALELFRQHAYDMIFMDIGLPDMDGYTVTKEIRYMEGNRKEYVPIIALSAHTDTDYKKRCFEAGMGGVLSKPLSKSQALEVLNAFIPARAAQKRAKIKASAESPAPKENDLLVLQGKIFDKNYLKETVGLNDEAVQKLPKSFAKILPEDIAEFTESYERKNLNKMQQLAHKLKGAAVYAGALRLHEICSRLEKYLSEGKEKLVSDFYEVVMKEVMAIYDYVEKN